MIDIHDLQLWFQYLQFRFLEVVYDFHLSIEDEKNALRVLFHLLLAKQTRLHVLLSFLILNFNDNYMFYCNNRNDFKL